MLMNLHLINSPEGENVPENIVLNEEQAKNSIYTLFQKSQKEQEKKKKAPNHAEEVIGIIRSLEFYCDPLGYYHALIANDENKEVVNIDSDKFGFWLSRLIYDKHKILMEPKKVRLCIGIALPEIAEKAKDTKYINRIAHTENALYINRGLKKPSFIKVDYDTGQRELVAISPFVPKLTPLPDRGLDIQKSTGGCFKEYFELMRVDTVYDRILCLTYLISKFFPERRGAFLHLIGEPGCGKTTLSWTLKNILDPDDVGMIPLKKDELIQFFDHSAIPVLDNLGTISKEFSNTLCSILTGATLLKREHFTNDKDFIYNVMNSGILTSIKIPSTASDLISRTYFIKKHNFSDNEMESDYEVRQKFKMLRPYLLDELIDIFLEVRKLLPGCKIKGNDRNMDFKIIGRIVSSLIADDEYLFDEIERQNKLIKLNLLIGNSPEAMAITEFMADKKKHVTTPTNMIAALNSFGCKENNYHRSPVHFARRLNLVRDLLREKGIEVVGGNSHSDHGNIYTFINHNYVESDDELSSDLAESPDIDTESELS
jgi:ABC-type oligopeptide transport system ATPase subunit